jgi:S-adenosylmethionine:tRNA ribosyltransferase-isomerase
VELSDASLPQRFGQIPLPPYIRREADEVDRERYQTVYAREDGSVAAPTAGLHFTGELLAECRARDVTVAQLTLHVGPGTFVPVRCADPAQHHLEQEHYTIPQAVASEIESARKNGRPVLAVGTTVVRALETTRGAAGSGRTSLFVLPGFHFEVVDLLLTNFHLPRSTLLMLVCAFAGREKVLEAYAEAVRRGYRFYSYGDAMLIR